MTPQLLNDSPLLDTFAASQFLHLARQTLAALRVRGGGPRYVKAGKKILYRTSDLHAWVNARTRASTSDCDLEAETPSTSRRGRAA